MTESNDIPFSVDNFYHEYNSNLSLSDTSSASMYGAFNSEPSLNYDEWSSDLYEQLRMGSLLGDLTPLNSQKYENAIIFLRLAKLVELIRLIEFVHYKSKLKFDKKVAKFNLDNSDTSISPNTNGNYMKSNSSYLNRSILNRKLKRKLKYFTNKPLNTHLNHSEESIFPNQDTCFFNKQTDISTRRRHCNSESCLVLLKKHGFKMNPSYEFAKYNTDDEDIQYIPHDNIYNSKEVVDELIDTFTSTLTNVTTATTTTSTTVTTTTAIDVTNSTATDPISLFIDNTNDDIANIDDTNNKLNHFDKVLQPSVELIPDIEIRFEETNNSNAELNSPHECQLELNSDQLTSDNNYLSERTNRNFYLGDSQSSLLTKTFFNSKSDLEIDSQVNNKCLKLRTCKSENTIAQKASTIKMVTFADEIGKCLTETFLFKQDESEINYTCNLEAKSLKPCMKKQWIKSDFMAKLDERNKMDSSNPELNRNSKFEFKTNYDVNVTWKLNFIQPATKYYEFRQTIETNMVSLENVNLFQIRQTINNNEDHDLVMSTDEQYCCLLKINGTIKVRNINYEKHVFLRLTTNEWETFTDYQAYYNEDLSQCTSSIRYDTFNFLINLTIDMDSKSSVMNHGKDIEFAICYTTGCIGDNNVRQYWDNNNGANYKLKQIKEIQATNMSNNSINHTTNSFASTNIDSYTTNCDSSNFESFSDYRAWKHYNNEIIYY